MREHLPLVPLDNSKLENFVSLRKTQDKNFSIPPVKVEFVLENLASLQSNKTMGVDKISARTLKIAAPVIAPSVVKLLNFSLQSTLYPQRWKTAKVTPIHKSGDHDDVGNYRPVSVLPTLSKILEGHVHKSLYGYLIENNLSYSQQSGFRRYYSTETALIRIVDQLLLNLDKNRVSGLIMIDYCKAFDMVDHELLLMKLKTYGISETSYKWFESYLQGRQHFVSFG